MIKLIKKYKWLIVFICLILFLLLAEDVFNNEIMYGDIVGYNLIKTYLINDKITPIMKAITFMGSAYFILTLIILFFIFIKNKKICFSIACNLAIVTILNQVFKIILARPRPTEFRIIEETGYSFPSGHSMIAMAFYGYLIYLIHRYLSNKKVKKILIIPMFLLIILIGISRIYLGVHYTSDVLAGFLISISYLILYIRVSNKLLIEGNNKMKNKKLINSFKYAFTGIFSAFKTERNLKIHISVMFLVIIFGFLLRITLIEWLICIGLFALVIGGELFNTAIETVVDIAMPKIDERAKKAKDVSASAVLVFAIGAFIIGLLIFVPKFIALF